MKYTMSAQERDFFIQLIAGEQYALVRGTSEEYLLCIREKMQFYQQVKVKYGIQNDAMLSIITDAGVIVTYE